MGLKTQNKMAEVKTKLVEETLSQSGIIVLGVGEERLKGGEVEEEERVAQKGYEEITRAPKADDQKGSKDNALGVTSSRKEHKLSLRIPDKREVLGDAGRFFGAGRRVESEASLFSDIEEDDVAVIRHFCCVSDILLIIPLIPSSLISSSSPHDKCHHHHHHLMINIIIIIIIILLSCFP